MIATTITITDSATPALLAKLKQCDPHEISTKIVPPLTKHWRDHLASLPKNRNNFPSTGFWEAAARSVHGVAIGGDAKITADKLGLRQRLYGGTITARNVQNLTIPICAEAYGTTVADWGFDNLVLVILADGRKFLALWLGYDQAQEAYNKNLSKLTLRAETTANRVRKFKSSISGDAKKPDVIIFRGTGNGAASTSRASRHMNLKFLFVLKYSVEQAGNPLVLPPDLQEFALEQVKLATGDESK